MGNCAGEDTRTLNKHRIERELSRYEASGDLPRNEGLRELTRRFGDYLSAIATLGVRDGNRGEELRETR